jgi:hypothetical protein
VPIIGFTLGRRDSKRTKSTFSSMVQIRNGLELDGNAAFVLGEVIHSGDRSFRFIGDLRILLVQTNLYWITHFGRSAGHQIKRHEH